MESPTITRRSRRRAQVTAAALIAVLLGAAVLAVVWSRSRQGDVFAWSADQDGRAGSSPAAPIDPQPRPDSYAETIARVAPAVVTIVAERTVQGQRQLPPIFDDPLFRDFFGGRDPQAVPGPQRQQGLGSGVVVSADGRLLTNHHVIDGADRLRVELADHRRFTATVVGSDPPTDLAVLKIEAASLPTIALGDSEAVRVGDVVLALGNPLGIGQTVTLGIISAKDRATGLGDGSFEDFLQTDAAINSGNSGGALVNARGELVGINSQILSPSGGNIGIGFAIPVNMARTVMDALTTEGRVRRGRLGVTIQPMTDDLARSLGMEQVTGAIVSDIEPDGPAASAGLRRGDVIVGLNGAATTDANDLRNAIAAAGPDAEVRLDIVRGGQRQQVTATLDELPSRGTAGSGTPGRDSGAAGLSVEPVPADRARALGLPAGTGLVVARVEPGGAAAAAGVRPGDVILEVDSTPVTSSEHLRTLLTRGDRPALVLIRRGDQSVFVTIERRA